jgi:hypothetical protein
VVTTASRRHDGDPWALVEGFADAPQEVTPEDLAGASASLRRVLALASELGADVGGLSTDVASDPLVASYQISALAPVTPLDAQHLLEAPGPVDRLRAATRALDERAEVLLAELGSGG